MDFEQRDNIAMHAMLALIAKQPVAYGTQKELGQIYMSTAFGAYAYADAMIMARDYTKKD